MSIANIFSRLVAKIPIRGTLTTPSGEETFPVAVSNEIMGGPFIVDSIEELKDIPPERILKGCKCTVNQYTEGDAKVPTRTYICIVVPSEKLSVSGDAVESYWRLDNNQLELDTTVEYQYSKNYSNKRPPFLVSDISYDAYQEGYATNEDYDAGDTSKKIWHSEYDAVTDKWVRQRTGTLSDWGIPVAIEESYSEGSYSDVRFQWKLTSEGNPATPPSIINGIVNNNPSGWTDGPEIPEGETYENYILTHTLWRTSAIKGVYGDLLSEWSVPIKVSTDPNLVRYGVDPYNTDYLNNTYWRAYYSTGDKFRASRESIEQDWVIERIVGESGEYIDYVFKEFQNSYEPILADRPSSVLGYGVDGWKDSVFTVQEGYTLYVSTARKFSDGSLSEDWSIPVRYDGKNTIRAVIVPTNNSGYTFKNANINGSKTVTPTSIILQSQLYDALKQVSADDITSVEWYRGDVETGTLIPKLPIGTEPNRNPQYGGTNDTELTIFPENVTGNQLFSCRVTFNSEDYIDSIDIVDISDGLGYQSVIESSSGFIYKGTESKDYTAYFYENGVDISTSTNVSYVWKLNNTQIGTSRTVSIDDTQIDGITVLSVDISIHGNTYTRTEALTDVSDGVSVIRYFTAKETIDLNNTPDTAGNPDEWSLDSASAVWAIEKYEGGDWNTPYRIKGEKGTPNGAFQKTVYRTQAPSTTPSWISEAPTAQTEGTGGLVPTDWSDNPESSAATGSTIWGSKATFLKNPSNENVEEIVNNWNIVSSWSVPFKVTTFPEAGSSGSPGTDGTNGWSPKFAITSDGERRVQKLVEWIGGTGAKPTGEGYYVGSTSLVSAIADAVDIRGPQGIQGNDGADGAFDASDFWATDVYRQYGSNGSPNYESWDFRFRLAKNGLVYYSIRWYRGGNGARNRDFALSGIFTPDMAPVQESMSAAVGIETLVSLNSTRFKDGVAPSLDPDNTHDKVLIIRQVVDNTPLYTLRLRFSEDYGGSANGCYATIGALSI